MPARPPARREGAEPSLPHILFPSRAVLTRPEAVPSGVENWEALWGTALRFEAFLELIHWETF